MARVEGIERGRAHSIHDSGRFPCSDILASQRGQQWTLIRERMSESRDERWSPNVHSRSPARFGQLVTRPEIIAYCCLKDGEAVGMCGTRRAEEVAGRPVMAFARAGCCRLPRRGERWTGGGYLSPPRSPSPVERSLPIHLWRAEAGSGRHPLRWASMPIFLPSGSTSQATLIRWAQVPAVTFWVVRPTSMTLLLLENAQSPKARQLPGLRPLRVSAERSDVLNMWAVEGSDAGGQTMSPMARGVLCT